MATRAAQVFGGLSMAAGSFLAQQSTASANAKPEPIRNFQESPSGIPVGCSGWESLPGVRFEANGREYAKLRDIPIPEGGVQVTAKWDGFNPACLDANGVPLAVPALVDYRYPVNGDPSFRQDREQQLEGWESANGANQVSAFLAGPTSANFDGPCSYQHDLVLLGREQGPLKVIGPNAGQDFYSNFSNRPNRPGTLVVDSRFGNMLCAIPTTTTTAPTTTTQPPTTTTQPVGSTTTTEATTTTAPPETTAPTPTLPETGRDSTDLGLWGGAMLAGGAGLIVASSSAARRKPA